MKITIFFPLIIILLGNIIVHSQPYNPYAGVGGIDCQSVTPVTQEKNLVTPGGERKPERTNIYQGTNNQSVFRILIVFVQFTNDYTYSSNSDWPAQDEPIYMNTLLAPERHNYHVEDWWNEYSESTETISDYFALPPL